MADEIRDTLGAIHARLEEVRHAQDEMACDVKDLLKAQAADAAEIANLKLDVSRAHARIGKLERAGIPDEEAIVRRTREAEAERGRIKTLEDGLAAIQAAKAIVRSEGWSIAKTLLTGAAGGAIALAFKAAAAWIGIGGP